MLNDFDLVKQKFGSVVYDGVEYALASQAWLDSDKNNVAIYLARAINESGKKFFVEWDPFENFMEMDDESEVCDWDAPCNVYPND